MEFKKITPLSGDDLRKSPDISPLKGEKSGRKRFIALLRGINVSGQKLIKMADLKALFEKCDFTNVGTYIQSGNVLFEAKESAEKCILKIKTAIQKKYKFEVEILLLDTKYLTSVVKNNPFTKRKDFDEKRMYVSFLNEKPTNEKLKELEKIKSGADEWKYIDQQLYFYCPDGYGKTKFSNNLVENKLKVVATTRNWNTVNTLLEML